MADVATTRAARPNAFRFSKVHRCKIHPGIGIARVGNSLGEYFIGPEAPCDPHDVTAPNGSFKDADGRIKRQAARFRIYAYDRKGNNLGELPLGSAKDRKARRAAQVEWKVHLKNKKGAWYKLVSRFEPPDEIRNADIPVGKGKLPDSRLGLGLDPGARCIDGEGDPVEEAGMPKRSTFETGMFLGTPVPLGELKVDKGRLLVLGGFGKSDSTQPDNPIGSDPAKLDFWANNDYWYDDVSDGPVTARVTLPSGRSIVIDRPQDAAWVIVAPPKYAPGIHSIVTLYDVILDVAVEPNPGFMPLLSGDEGERPEGEPRTWLSVLLSQYRKLKLWRDGKFSPGRKPKFPPLERMDPDEQVEALQRAALEPCVGGAFYPGIEAPWIVGDKDLYVHAFRINSKTHGPGDITKYMCVPWQADFYDCKNNWWPAARPDDVISQDVFEEANNAWRPGQPRISEALEGSVKWDRGLGVTTLFRRPWHNPAEAVDDPLESERRGCDDMVRYWHELGFVLPRKTAWWEAGSSEREIVQVEMERRPPARMELRELCNGMLHLEEDRSCLPKVREFVQDEPPPA